MATTFAFLPGVRIQEVQLGAPPISGVGTSTGGFVGKVPIDNRTDKTSSVQFVTSADDFTAKFITGCPAATTSSALVRAVYGFFRNGGTALYVSLVDDDTDAAKLTTGLGLLGKHDDVEIIAVPGSTIATVTKALTDQASALRDRVAILDAIRTTDPTTDLLDAAKRPADSIFGAYYYPRISVAQDLPADPATEFVSPTGSIAGIYAQVDGARGVHKAPANIGIAGALGAEYRITDSENDTLNKNGVNCLRIFNGNVVVWGARTLQANDTQGGDPLFRYINIRRLTNYIEQSLKSGLRFATFEPNNLSLRQIITRSVRGFLDGVFRDGALFGATTDDAYYVRFPDAFNTDADRLAGKLVLEIGIRPAPPAEFIIVRIGILTQSASAQ